MATVLRITSHAVVLEMGLVNRVQFGSSGVLIRLVKMLETPSFLPVTVGRKGYNVFSISVLFGSHSLSR